MKTSIHTVLRHCFLGVLCAIGGQVSAALVEWSAGHGDIGLAYEDGELELHYHLHDGTIVDGSPLSTDKEYGPGEAYIRIADSAKLTPGFAVPFLNTGASDPIWVLPASGTSASALGLPFLGLSYGELEEADFGPSPYATLSMTGFRGPGEFAVWQQSGFTSTVFFQTYGGISSLDFLVLADHDHYNFGFTQEGVYDVELTATANLFGGGSVTDKETFKFVVGSTTAVPEPGSLVALATIGLVGMVICRRRKS